VIQIIQYEDMQWQDTGSLSFEESKEKLKLQVSWTPSRDLEQVLIIPLQPADLLYLLDDFRLKVESKLGQNGRGSLSGNRAFRKTELSTAVSLLDGIEIATFVQSVCNLGYAAQYV
jgi:hypothetical protein